MQKDGTTKRQSLEELRKRAEARALSRPARMKGPHNWNLDELVHELEVHQIELEMQNDELRSAQTALEHSRDRYFELYDLAPVGYLTLDRLGKIEEANLAAAALLGTERGRLVGRLLSDFVNPRHADDFQRHLGEVFNKGAKLGLDISFCGANAAGTEVHIDSVAFVDDTGQRTRCRSVLINLSELRTAQQRQHASEARAKSILDTVADAIVSSDSAGRIESFNTAAECLFGYVAAEVVGQNVSILMPAPYRGEHDLYMSRYVSSGAAQMIGRPTREVFGLKKDGTIFPLELSVGEFLDGGKRKFTAILRDLTAYKRKEQELRDAETRFREIAQHIDDVFMVHDRDKRCIIYANPAFETIWGRPVSELYESAGEWPDWIFSADRGLVEEAYRDYLAGAPLDLTHRICRPDGNVRWLRVRATPMAEPDGSILHDVLVLQDITQQHELEVQLRQAQKLEAIGTLASGVAHDFNNLLMGVSGCASVALDCVDPGSAARLYLNEIKRATQSGAGITRQLLAFSRQAETQRAVFELNAAIATMGPMLRRLVGEDISVDIALKACDSRVEMDPIQLEQVVMNLVVNARDAMPKGGHLSLETALISSLTQKLGREAVLGETRDGEYVNLSVTDTGSGMTDSVKDRIFDPFFTTKEQDRGTGLGLSTACGIVRQAGGSIKVESEPGQGTRFDLFLPHAADKEITQEISRPTPTNDVSRAAVILLCEDDRMVRMATRYFLERGGYRVLEAATGAEAIECCAKFPETIDLFLTDVILPGKGGNEVIAEVTRLRPETKILCMSAHSASWLREQGRIDHSISTLQKPFDEEQLLSRIHSLLGGPACNSDVSPGNGADVEAPVFPAGGKPAASEGDVSVTREQDFSTTRGLILVVEDSSAARLAIATSLEDAGWTVVSIDTGDKAKKLVEEDGRRFDLLLVDYLLPDTLGDVLARELCALLPELAVVYMTGQPNFEPSPPGPVLEKPLALDEVCATVAGLVG